MLLLLKISTFQYQYVFYAYENIYCDLTQELIIQSLIGTTITGMSVVFKMWKGGGKIASPFLVVTLASRSCQHYVSAGLYAVVRVSGRMMCK